MGLSGWLGWLGEEIARLETLKSMTKDKAQRDYIDSMIADLKSKKEA